MLPSTLTVPEEDASHDMGGVDGSRGLSRHAAAAGSGRSQAAQEKKKVQLRLHRAWGLAKAAKQLDAFVTVRARGRDVGATRVAAVGATTSPEWIDEE